MSNWLAVRESESFVMLILCAIGYKPGRWKRPGEDWRRRVFLRSLSHRRL